MGSKDVVLRAESLSKRYRIGAKATEAHSRREAILNFLSQPYRRFRDLQRLARFGDGEDESIIWALRDISFEVCQGEVLGIMGANGAGKSTLLKMLSRIISPTSGQFWYKGTLASLLEVGTGFNGELTGRENIYLNGSMLGMRQSDIDKVFDEIVDFSGVERFIDTPVKRYSSGMTVRLAFSVAAHLDPDILILDEVLSVGDAQFSEKSIKKMESVAFNGKTVLFVSHSTNAVAKLCDRAIFLSGGSITASGTVADITGLYLGDTSHNRISREWKDTVAPRAEGLVKLMSARIVDEFHEPVQKFDIRQKIGVEISFEILQSSRIVLAEIQVFNEKEQLLFTAVEHDHKHSFNPREKGLYTVICWIPGNFLAEGRMILNVGFCNNSPHESYMRENGVLLFDVEDFLQGDSVRYDYGAPVPGLLRPRLDWEG